jgi:hypothetical protein
MMSSRNRKRRVEQFFEGEIRFGPEYFRLAIDGRVVPKRIFGKPFRWSSDSRLLAAQEWLAADYASGPVTCAALIDVQAWAIVRMETIQKGFAQDFRFEGDLFVYQKSFPAKSELIETMVVLSTIKGWKGLGA